MMGKLKEDLKLAAHNMSIHPAKREHRISIPQFLMEIFDINPKEDKFNWYVKRTNGRVRLVAILNKKGHMKDFHLKAESEKHFEKESELNDI